ncbi:kinase-like protein [Ophiobolus disseminans]|uniref:Kinase-like protein n=1 Tax=Ophiobolus disseminans TaxID=1469910 RepID=A0A6A6ZZT3_9PLEO|nr:kinase-like protein [Ophiobolus disseminans]
MADGRNFRDLRDLLYRDLVALSCVPRVETDGIVTEQLERRFFPSGTATKVLTFSKLEQVFTLIIATGKIPSSVFHPAQLAQQLANRNLHVYLAILITSKCDIESLLSFTEKLVVNKDWTDADHELARLPAERRSSLRIVVGDDVTADIFFQRQHDFFAPILEKNREVRGHFRRVPYLREKLIGQGSFGRVFEVVISPHHFKDQHSMSNDRELVLARKDFELNAEDRAHEQERDVLREIVRNAKKHNNIMKSLGSLENGMTYSVFMPLANCDLKQYMESHPIPPRSPNSKALFVQCAIGLAGAIVYLHEELESPMYERLSCFHMDLKPQNILVVIDPSTGLEQWKLSDFNMSRVKLRPNSLNEQSALGEHFTFGDKIYEINKLFKRRIPDAGDTSISDYTIGRRGAGTYLSPEACIEDFPVHAESDTWSLGCVVSVIFSYLYRGQSAVTEFADSRSKKGQDTFYVFSDAKGPPKLGDARVNDAVKRWHKQLLMETKRRDPQEGAIYENILDFLSRRVLVIEPRKRREITAADIREQLIVAFKAFRSMASIPGIPPSHPKSSKSRFRMLEFSKFPWKRTPEEGTQSRGSMSLSVDEDSVASSEDDQVYHSGFPTRKLDRILSKSDNEDTNNVFSNHGISDLWLPIARQTLRGIFLNTQNEKAFLNVQGDCLDTRIKISTSKRTMPARTSSHTSLDDDENLVRELGVLGEGAFGVVEKVSITVSYSQIVCVRKRIGRPKQLKSQKQIMAAFAREICVMRQVHHRHCVEFLGSYTDADHVNILSLPIADMDLATFLDKPIDVAQRRILYRGLGCLCNAMNYLHAMNIRHEDLKPQNVLLHGENLLLTDFGFSLDFSDDSVSTTTGRPAAWTIRYSAPEVLNFEPRNRATDIFSLGCVLLEMISGFHGKSLTTVKEFWKCTGNAQSSFARNPEAATAWIKELRKCESGTPKIHALSSFLPRMLETDRLHRPTIRQVVNRLSDLSILHEDSVEIVTSCFGNTPCIGLSHPTEGAHRAMAERLSRMPHPAEYFHPWEYKGEWAWGLWDLTLSLLDVEHSPRPADPIYDNMDEIRQTCDMLYEQACRTKVTKDFWNANRLFENMKFDKAGCLHALISAKMLSLKHVVFTRLSLRTNLNFPNRKWHVQIALLPICLRRSPYYGSFFWMISYPLNEVAGEWDSMLNGQFVDLTTAK